MLPQFRPGQRLAGERLTRHSGVPSASAGQHRATREIDADADDVARFQFGLPHCRANGRRAAIQPVLRILQRVVRRQPIARRRKRFDKLTVTVARDRRTEFHAIAVDQQCSHRLGAEIKT